MPAYITHAIMGNAVYELLSKNNILKIELNPQTIRTFSLGIDLAGKNKNHAQIAHNKDTGVFFLIMVDYIKSNRLYNNPKIMAFLYGHIFHYFLDTNMHPYVYYIEKGLVKPGLIGTHTFIEGAIDSYLSEELLRCNIFDLNGSQFCLNETIDDNILKEMVDYTYQKLYEIKNISSSYSYILSLLRNLERIVKFKICKHRVKKILQIDKYFSKNILTREEILNCNKNLWLHPTTGEIHSESVEELFDKAVNEAAEAIEIVNKVIYDNLSIDILYDLFPDISYDTGISCKKMGRFRYKRNKC